MAIEDVVRKIKALRNVNGRTPEEAAAFAAKAAELMMQHQIDEAMLGHSDEGELVDGFVGRHRRSAWRADVILICAKICGCVAYNDSAGNIRCVGTKSDVESTLGLWSYVLAQMQAAHLRACAMIIFETAAETTSFSKSFDVGCCEVVANKLRALWEARMLDLERRSQTALLIIRGKIQRIDAWMSTRYSSVGSAKLSSSVADWLGYVEGKAAGARVDVGNAGKKLLKA